MSWKFSIGNLAQRAANAPAAVSPAVSDALLPLSHLATGYPDEEAAFEWRSDGNYAVSVNLNLLANTSSRTDAPTGWRDLLLDYAGTPGLSANPPDWNTYGGRTALRTYRPLFQDVDVMPGENMAISAGIYIPAASAATGVRIRVTNTTTGLSWSGTNNVWESGGVVEVQTTDNTWDDFTETITADANSTFRSTYRVVYEPVANSYDATTYVYLSGNGGGTAMPALYGEIDFVALVGHNIPKLATVAAGNFSFSTIYTPTAYAVGNSEITQTLTLSIQMPSGAQPRPRIGEAWFGKLTTLTRGIDPDIDVNEGDPAQLRVQGSTGRQEVMTDIRFPVSYTGLNVRTFTDAQWEQYRNRLIRGTRFGADPLVLVPPDELQGAGRVIHGRLGPVIGTKHKDQSWREFTLSLAESPFAPA